jgi:hypothetical protein
LEIAYPQKASDIATSNYSKGHMGRIMEKQIEWAKLSNDSKLAEKLTERVEAIRNGLPPLYGQKLGEGESVFNQYIHSRER